jgi:hypothetical protein
MESLRKSTIARLHAFSKSPRNPVFFICFS